MMDVGSEKRLVAAAKQAMVLLNPEWPAYAALKGALEAAQKPVAVGHCACGHLPDKHQTDALENLLKCKASRCKCDHFHYAAPSDAAAAA